MTRYDVRHAALRALALDCGNGDRGNVAPPAAGMPRSLSARCMGCGCDNSVRNMNRADPHIEYCEMCAGKMGMGEGSGGGPRSLDSMVGDPDDMAVETGLADSGMDTELDEEPGRGAVPEAAADFDVDEPAGADDDELDKLLEITALGDWQEDLHPRDDNGKFSGDGGGITSSYVLKPGEHTARHAQNKKADASKRDDSKLDGLLDHLARPTDHIHTGGAISHLLDTPTIGLSETPEVKSVHHPPNPFNIHAPKGSAPAGDPGTGIGPVHFEEELAKVFENRGEDGQFSSGDAPDPQDTDNDMNDRLATALADWQEDLHPRADDGKFSGGGGGSTASASIPKEKYSILGADEKAVQHTDDFKAALELMKAQANTTGKVAHIRSNYEETDLPYGHYAGAPRPAGRIAATHLPTTAKVSELTTKPFNIEKHVATTPQVPHDAPLGFTEKAAALLAGLPVSDWWALSEDDFGKQLGAVCAFAVGE